MKQRIIELLQKSLNCYLALDPESKPRLLGLQNKVVMIELLTTGLIFHFTFSDQELQLQMGAIENPDIIIKGTPLRLLHLACSPQNRQAFFSDDVVMQGNIELAQQVIALFDQLEIDWEEYLSQWLTDAPAHQLGRIARRIKNWSQNTRSTLYQNINEYVHEEISLFPTAEALQDFFQDVDTLVMDVERAEARLQHLEMMNQTKRGIE